MEPEELSTDALVDRASRGDGPAADRLLERYRPELERFLRGRASAELLARESGTDLAQSVCREALERLSDERLELRGEAAFRQWLFRAAELKLQNRWRYWQAQRRAAAHERPLFDEDAERLLLRSLFSPSGEAVRREELERFRQALAELDERQHLVLTLVQLQGASHAEAARRLEISEGASRKLLARALARLARLLREG